MKRKKITTIVTCIILTGLTLFGTYKNILRYDPDFFKRDGIVMEKDKEVNTLRETLSHLGFVETTYDRSKINKHLVQYFSVYDKDGFTYKISRNCYLVSQETISIVGSDNKDELILDQPVLNKDNFNAFAQCLNIHDAYEMIQSCYQKLKKEDDSYIYQDNTVEILIEKNADATYTYQYRITITAPLE